MTYNLKIKNHPWSILEYWLPLQSYSILQKKLIHGIHLFWKSKMGFQFGIINIVKAINASTESSSCYKEANILDLEEIKNMNLSTSGEDTSLIWNKIFNTKSTIQPDKDKLFFQMIIRKILSFKDHLAQADSVLLKIFIHN